MDHIYLHTSAYGVAAVSVCNVIRSCLQSLPRLLVYVLYVASTVKLCSASRIVETMTDWPQILKYLPSDLSQNKFVGPVVGPWKIQFTLPKRQKAIKFWILLALISSVFIHVYLAREGSAVFCFSFILLISMEAQCQLFCGSCINCTLLFLALSPVLSSLLGHLYKNDLYIINNQVTHCIAKMCSKHLSYSV